MLTWWVIRGWKPLPQVLLAISFSACWSGSLPRMRLCVGPLGPGPSLTGQALDRELVPPRMTVAAATIAKADAFALNGRTMSVYRFSPGRSRFRRFAAGLALAGILVRALIPLGYMPGNVLDGEFMVLCPSGLPAKVVHALHGHHDADAALELDRACPIGGALQYVALPTDVVDAVNPESHPLFIAPEPVVFRGTRPLRLFRARAPPLATI